MNILGTGLTGLVGSRVTDLLSVSHTFENLSLETGVDITKPETLQERFAASSAPWVFHFAAYTDVQGAEKEKELREQSAAWKVNVDATKNIVALCKKLGKRLLYLSTDYVFDGTKDAYGEEDIAHPQGFYAETKYRGEEAVGTLGDQGLIIRIANPYRARPVGKKDFMHKMKERLEGNLPISAPNDQLLTATFIDDLASGIAVLIEANASGVYHLPGGDALSPYDAAMQIASVFHLNVSLISKTTFAAYFAGKAPIPQKGVLKHDKIDALGITLHTFERGLEEVKKQEEAFL